MWFLTSGISFSEILMRIVSVLIIVFFVLPVHEWAHGFVAYKLGDPTAKNSGRLTLDPIASIDPIGALGILLFGFGWAKPVPVDPRYFKNPKRDMALTALAGPVVNIIAAVIGAFILNILVFIQGNLPRDLVMWLGIFLQYYVSINVGLAVFNMLPIPPLDGSRVAAAFMSDDVMMKYYKYQNVIVMIVFVLIFTRILTVPLGMAQNAIYSFIMNLTSLPFKLF
ncbi:MAG: site-2 protease family protein [Clostridia bacterium]|nr:site-2 protease family protein [Clostridia bacterium]